MQKLTNLNALRQVVRRDLAVGIEANAQLPRRIMSQQPSGSELFIEDLKARQEVPLVLRKLAAGRNRGRRRFEGECDGVSDTTRHARF